MAKEELRTKFFNTKSQRGKLVLSTCKDTATISTKFEKPEQASTKQIQDKSSTSFVSCRFEHSLFSSKLQHVLEILNLL